jgi:hypothetical protein
MDVPFGTLVTNDNSQTPVVISINVIKSQDDNPALLTKLIVVAPAR